MSNRTEHPECDEPTFWEALERYAQRIETGEIISPSDFLQRCELLRRRGLRGPVVDDLRASGSISLLRQVESLTVEQVRELNVASRAGGSL